MILNNLFLLWKGQKKVWRFKDFWCRNHLLRLKITKKLVIIHWLIFHWWFLLDFLLLLRSFRDNWRLLNFLITFLIIGIKIHFTSTNENAFDDLIHWLRLMNIANRFFYYLKKAFEKFDWFCFFVQLLFHFWYCATNVVSIIY